MPVLTTTQFVHARDTLARCPEDIPVADWLYQRWFHQMSGQTCAYPGAGDYQVVCADSQPYQPGWTVVQNEISGQAAAVKVTDGTRQRVVAPPHVFAEDPTILVLQPGTKVCVNPIACAPNEGFFHLHSLGWQREGMPVHRKRLYFSIVPGSELAFVRQCLISASPVACWSMKILCEQSSCGRRDVAVMYLQENESLEESWMARLIEELGECLLSNPLPMTVELAPGVSLAPDLSSERSFGQIVCDALADAVPILDSQNDPDVQLDSLNQQLQDLLSSGFVA